ncbi:conserved domain protein [Acinetobacter baumannii 6013150]|nr:conserved domain protein [Acinetobacter baumannii 6013150]EGJ66146.1 conserved domain protein [Acinetobacter baumannii 6013113]
MKKFSKWKIYFYIKKAKASYSSIIKSIFINILHKLKKEKYIVGTCFA